MPGGGGEGWGFDCLCWPGGIGHLTDLVLPGEGDISIFLRPTRRYLTADLDKKD